MARTPAWLLTALLACDAPPPTTTPPWGAESLESPAPPAPAEPPKPPDVAQILHELAPIPGRTAVIVYDIVGPAGIAGTLETLVADGGYRRDNWVLTLPLPDGVQELRGSRVSTPALRWHGEGEDAGRKQPAQLATTAAAIAALDPVARTRVLDELRGWRAELEHARIESPGERDHVAGLECVRVRAGAGEVCTCEALGLPLRYTGPAFSVVARHVEQGTVLGPHAFEIPADAVADAPSSAEPLRLAAIAAGDRAEILRLLRPELAPLPELLPNE